MPNEPEVKRGWPEPICSVTGRRCVGRCGRGGCGGRLDDVPEAALSWARSAVIQLDGPIGSLEQCLDVLKSQRGYPGPEIREALRSIEAAKKLIEEACE